MSGQKRLQQLREAFRSGTLPKAEYIEKMHGVHALLHDYADFLRGSPVKRIEIEAGELRMVMSNGLVIVVPPADHRLAPMDALNFGAYEESETEMMLRLVRDGDTVLDIGANVGWYSLILAKERPKCRVLAFEPIPDTYAGLRRHIEMNGATNVETFPFGFSDREADPVFYFYPEGSVNASLADLSGRESTKKVQCHVKRLDDFVKQQRLRADFIKCDVEGAELLVFQGGVNTLREQKPAVFTEMLRKWSAKFNYHPNQIIELFESLGYECFTIAGSKLRRFGRMDEKTLETNFFFLHWERHSQSIRELAL